MPYTFHEEDHHFTSKFEHVAAIGKSLMDLHLHYEDAPEYPLTWHWTEPKSWHVERMRFNRDKTIIIVNPSLFLSGIPPEAHAYQLGNRSALEWVMDQYRVTEDTRSGIVSDPNRADDPEYIARLVCKVCFVSVETVRLQRRLSEITGPDDWIGVDEMEHMFEQSAKAEPDMPDESLWSKQQSHSITPSSPFRYVSKGGFYETIIHYCTMQHSHHHRYSDRGSRKL